MAHSSTRDIINPYTPAYTTRQMRRNHAAIGGVVPGCVLAGIRKMLDVRYATPCTPTPCTLPLQGYQQLTDRSLHESYIQPNTQNAGKSAESESCESPGHSMSAEPYRHVSRRGMANGSGISQHDNLPSASIAAYQPYQPHRTMQGAPSNPRVIPRAPSAPHSAHQPFSQSDTSQTAAAQPHSAVCSCAPSRSKSAMR